MCPRIEINWPSCTNTLPRVDILTLFKTEQNYTVWNVVENSHQRWYHRVGFSAVTTHKIHFHFQPKYAVSWLVL